MDWKILREPFSFSPEKSCFPSMNLSGSGKTTGKLLGRPKDPGKSKPDTSWLKIKALLANGSAQKFIAVRYKITPANLSNWIWIRNGLIPMSRFVPLCKGTQMLHSVLFFGHCPPTPGVASGATVSMVRLALCPKGVGGNGEAA